MKKNWIKNLAALAIALAVILPLIPPPCCDEHIGTDEICPPPISLYNIFPTADN